MERKMADFTDDELTLLTTTPSMIGSTIAFSESSGVVGTVTESHQYDGAHEGKRHYKS